MLLSPAQVLAARSILRLSIADVARLSVTSERTVKRAETGIEPVSNNALARIKEALEHAGVEFTESEPGVRLRD
jgi:predicted transcriptional regulator